MLFESQAKDADRGVWVYRCPIGHERILTKSDAAKTNLGCCEECDRQALHVATLEAKRMPKPVHVFGARQ